LRILRNRFPQKHCGTLFANYCERKSPCSVYILERENFTRAVINVFTYALILDDRCAACIPYPSFFSAFFIASEIRCETECQQRRNFSSHTREFRLPARTSGSIIVNSLKQNKPTRRVRAQNAIDILINTTGMSSPHRGKIPTEGKRVQRRRISWNFIARWIARSTLIVI